MAIYQPKVKPQLQKPKPHLPRTEFLTYLRSRAPFIGAALHAQTCWYGFPNCQYFMNLGAQNTALKEKVSKLCELRKVFQIFHLRFTGTILICVFQDLAATQPSVLQEPRVFLIQCLSLTKLKHTLARYRLLILGVS